MSRAAVSSLVHGMYLIIVALTLLAIPDVVLGLIGLAPHKDVYLDVAAILAFNLGVFFIVAARSEYTNFFRASVFLRYLFALSLAAFAALQLTRFNILVFGIPDVILATWTFLALRADRQAHLVK